MVDGIAVRDIAHACGTPLYIYSLPRLRANVRRLQAAFAPLRARLYYSVKANGSLAILRALHEAGTGFDCVSGGEIQRVLAAGAAAQDIVFAGVGKTRAEIEYAIAQGVGCITVENPAELQHMAAALRGLAALQQRVALRLNPQVSANTHPYMATGHGAAKFGMTAPVIHSLLQRHQDFPQLHIDSLHMHIGSQLADIAATQRALRSLLALAQEHPQISTLNLGGGLPVPYRRGESLPDTADFAAALQTQLSAYSVALEPGRAIVADAGLLVCEVLYVKRQAGQRFVIVDASMAELLRPALYQAQHEILPLQAATGSTSPAHVVGPVCESADMLALDAPLPQVQPGDKVAIFTAGAYGMAMASNYNARLRPPEVVVDDDSWQLSRRRETMDDLLRLERVYASLAIEKPPTEPV